MRDIILTSWQIALQAKVEDMRERIVRVRRACSDLGRLVKYEQERRGPMPSGPLPAEPPSAARRQTLEAQ